MYLLGSIIFPFLFLICQLKTSSGVLLEVCHFGQPVEISKKSCACLISFFSRKPMWIYICLSKRAAVLKQGLDTQTLWWRTKTNICIHRKMSMLSFIPPGSKGKKTLLVTMVTVYNGRICWKLPRCASFSLVLQNPLYLLNSVKVLLQKRTDIGLYRI